MNGILPEIVFNHISEVYYFRNSPVKVAAHRQRQILGRKALMELTTTVTPDTTLRWYRRLVAKR